MLRMNLQLLGGRGSSSGGGGGGSSSGGGGGGFKSESDFESSLTGANDPRLKAYSDAYDSEASYTKGLVNNMSQAINEDGYTKTVDSALKFEAADAKKAIGNMPELKTPEQLGQVAALTERLDAIKKLQGRKGQKGQGVGDVSILD